ncbi:MAG TPA: HAD hydrolase-like protein [Gammaproteobacteria bacterium]|nr:HAD hydrolase-like protein [Gammaproteobacteria bacterium]
MTHLVMFDIDGTLVDSMRVDSRLYARAVRETLGGDVCIDDTWRPYVHVTDSGILDEILVQHRFPEPLDPLRAEVKRRFIELVRGHLDAGDAVLREIRGATALLRELRARPDVRLAIATGGWAETALMKLAAIGVSVDGIGFASGSDAHARTRIMELAAERALRGAMPATRTYLGDGAWDQRASAELGYRFIAIGRALEHEPRFDDYADRDAVLACLAV